jgi:light-regulated signal transduction histidine kinase (bacteriophytochrome)
LGQGSSPAFGTADLSNCEREQIHLAASIQPYGAFLLLRETDGVIVQASARAGPFLGLAGDLLGRPVKTLGGDLWSAIRPWLGANIDAIPVGVSADLVGEIR